MGFPEIGTNLYSLWKKCFEKEAGTDDNTYIKVGIADSGNLDSFGRLRVSDPTDILDRKNIHDRGELHIDEELTGAGAITYNPQESSVSLTTGTASGDRTVRQSRYTSYIPGKSHLVNMTGVLSASGTDANTTRRIGYFDDNNGLYFQCIGESISVVRRTDTSGSVAEEIVEQFDWNLDGLNSNASLNPSNVTLDATKTQIFHIEFQWLGVGRVKFGLNVNGKTIFVHQMLNANVLTVPYIRTPNLPCRYEIVNTGTSAGTQEMKEICYTVASEAATTVFGLQFHANNFPNLRAVNTTEIPIMAIRLKNQFPASRLENRHYIKILRYGGFSSDKTVGLILKKVYSPTSSDGTWVSVDDHSAIEVNTTLTTISGSESHQVSCTMLPAGNQASGSTAVDQNEINDNLIIRQNFDSTNSDAFVVFAATYVSAGGTTDVEANCTWVERD